MSRQKALHRYLASKGIITDEVAAANIHWGRKRPVGTDYPEITFWIVTGTDEIHQTAGAGLRETWFQIDVWATSQTDTATIQNALRDVLLHYDGTMGSGDETMTVLHSTLGEIGEDVEEPADGSDQAIYRTSLDYRTWDRASIPTTTTTTTTTTTPA